MPAQAAQPQENRELPSFFDSAGTTSTREFRFGLIALAAASRSVLSHKKARRLGGIVVGLLFPACGSRTRQGSGAGSGTGECRRSEELDGAAID